MSTASTTSPTPEATPWRPALVVAGAIVAILLILQIPIALGLLDPDPVFEAAKAKPSLIANGVIAAATLIAAVLLPARWRWLALLPGGLLAVGMAGAAMTLGGHAWDYVTAALTFAAAWWLGRIALSALNVPALQGVFIVELVVGLGLTGLIVLTFGRMGLLRWWSVGLVIAALGVVGLWVGGRQAWSRRRTTWTAVTESRIAVVCAGLLLLQMGWAIVWLSAPEIMFDALYGKAYLPELWSQTGDIGPLLFHPVLNVAGLTQIVAAPGHALGSDDVGRVFQLFAWVTVVCTTWRWAGKRTAVGPLAALAVGIVPQLVWQSATAFDDLMLAVGGAALALGVLRTAKGPWRSAADSVAVAAPTFRTAVAIGLLAGACVWLKFNFLVLTLVLAAGWVVVAGPWRGLPRRLLGVLAGGAVVAAPALIIRWIDTGNPLFPSYNQIFRSSHYPLVNEQFNFPFWPSAGATDFLKLPYEATFHPWLMNDSMPEGALGMLTAALLIAALVGWRQPDRRAAVVVWAAVVISVVAWWFQFRYLRYLLPSALAAVMLVVALLRDWRPGRIATGVVLVGATAASILYLPTTVASFWNVPHRDIPFAAAFGRWDKQDYLRTAFPEKDALDAYQRLAPPGARAMSDAHERTFLNDRDLSPLWEVATLLKLSGPDPTTGADALRRLRALGIEWALVPVPSTSVEAYPWAKKVLDEHGELVFSDRNWELFHLVDRPSGPRMLASCDDRLKGKPGCWLGTLSGEPGLTEGESQGGVNRNIPVCPGQTVAVRVTTGPGGGPSTVALNGVGAGPLSGHVAEPVPPGTTGWAYGTVPNGVTQVNIALLPGSGSTITEAQVGLTGACAPG